MHSYIRGGSRNFREGFPYHSQWSSNFTAIFDGNSKFLPFIDLEKFYGQLIKILRWRGFLGTQETPLKPPLYIVIFDICNFRQRILRMRLMKLTRSSKLVTLLAHLLTGPVQCSRRYLQLILIWQSKPSLLSISMTFQILAMYS